MAAQLPDDRMGYFTETVEMRVTVQAFTSHMDNLLSLLQAMVDLDEDLNDEHREDGHG